MKNTVENDIPPRGERFGKGDVLELINPSPKHPARRARILAVRPVTYGGEKFIAEARRAELPYGVSRRGAIEEARRKVSYYVLEPLKEGGRVTEVTEWTLRSRYRRIERGENA